MQAPSWCRQLNLAGLRSAQPYPSEYPVSVHRQRAGQSDLVASACAACLSGNRFCIWSNSLEFHLDRYNTVQSAWLGDTGLWGKAVVYQCFHLRFCQAVNEGERLPVEK